MWPVARVMRYETDGRRKSNGEPTLGMMDKEI